MPGERRRFAQATKSVGVSWPAKVRRRDGTLVPFDIARIEAAVTRAAREVACDDPDMPGTVAKAVADALGRGIAPVEDIQDCVEARLGEAGLDDVARVYIIYRQRRAELRTAKALLGVRDELKLSLAAVTVLRERYLLHDEQGRPAESTGELMDRSARCVAAAEDQYEPGSSRRWAERFATLLRNLEFLPNSPTLMNSGTDLGLLAGCFVLPIEDSLQSIFATLGQAAELQRAGGGTGYAFSHLRPAGDRVASTGGTASGPVSFLRLYDSAAGVVSMGGRRRGACMAVLDVSHPDICDFVTAKAESPSELPHFNLSVGVTDAFLRAVERNGLHRLVNPRTGKIVARMPAAELFDAICKAAHAGGDPGLVFLDTINRANPVPGRGRIEATNPCGEVPLLPYESCNLGSINLARMLADGRVDWDRLEEVAGVAVRFLDDVIDVSRYPFPELGEAARATRKIGLGVMGLAELLAALGIPYDSEEAVRLATRLMRRIQQAGFYRDELIAEIAQRGGVRGYPRLPAEVRAAFPTAAEIAPQWHLRMQAAVQRHVEAAVSKTVNLPATATVDDVRAIYVAAWKAKVKGITVYRYGSREGQVLSYAAPKPLLAQADTEFSGGCAGRSCEF